MATAAKRKTPPRLTRKQRESHEVMLQQVNASSRGFATGFRIDLMRMDEEYVPALKSWPGRIDLYQRMGNDAKIAAVLRANILPIISAVRWKAEGGRDEAREIVASNLLRQGDPRYWCETSWTQRLFESLLSLQYGVSLFGKTREIVDGYMIFRRLTYLHPRSLGGPQGPWEWDENGVRLVAVHRSYRLPNLSPVFDERIPISDVFPVVWWMAGDNWEGVPMIRSMYRAYTEKDLAAKIQMIDLQNRGVGIPDVELAPGDGPKAAETLKKIAEDLRGGSKERAYVVRSPGQKVGFLVSSGTTLDSTPIIDGKNMEIAAASGTDFQQQGQTQSGSRATGSVLMVNYMQELDAIRQWVQDQINHGAGNTRGLTEELEDENFGPPGEEGYTKIVGSRVSPTEQLDNVPNILDAVQKGSLVHDLSVENYVRKSLGVPDLSADEFNRIKSVGERVPNLGGRPDSPTPTDVEDPRDDSAGRSFGLTEKKTLDGGKPQRRRGRSYVWLESTQS